MRACGDISDLSSLTFLFPQHSSSIVPKMTGKACFAFLLTQKKCNYFEISLTSKYEPPEKIENQTPPLNSREGLSQAFVHSFSFPPAQRIISYPSKTVCSPHFSVLSEASV